MESMENYVAFLHGFYVCFIWKMKKIYGYTQTSI